jgi:hypothetical protein
MNRLNQQVLDDTYEYCTKHVISKVEELINYSLKNLEEALKSGNSLTESNVKSLLKCRDHLKEFDKFKKLHFKNSFDSQ